MAGTKRRIDVMVSSTTNDLGEHRRRVGDVITRQLYTPRIMDNDSTTGKDGVTYSLDLVDEAEIYILLLGYRYGYVPDDPRNPDKLSMTHMEYRRAKERAKRGELHVLPFLMDDKFRPEIVVPELDTFRNEVLSDQIAFFSTIEELETKVLQALTSESVQTFLNPLMDTVDEAFKPTVGETLDNRYVFLEKLGQGGNGEVWKVNELDPDGKPARTVAIKLLKRDISDKPGRVDRFKKEISIALRINHPHVIRTTHWGEVGGQFYAVMDFVEGQTLRDHIAGKQFTDKQTVAILRQVAEALTMAHKQKIVHRDVKPENIMVHGDSVYLGDFGLAVSPDENMDITATGELVGTKKYMSPEQWDNQPTTPQTDIYALGLIAYEMLTGQFPYDASSHARLLLQHMNEPLPAHPDLPDEILKILRRATDKNPANRYATASELMTDLAHWQLDPANVETKIQKFLDGLRYKIKGDVYEQLFVDLEGDIREILPARPKDEPTDTYHDPYLDGLMDFAMDLDADHHEPETEEAQHVENILDQLTQCQRVVLVGEPGAGKSFTLRRLVMRYVNQFGTLGRIPVFVPLNAFKGDMSFYDYIKAQLSDDLKTYMDTLIATSRMVLLCDALNEMPRTGTDGRDLLTEVRDQLQKTPLFVVSCRVRDYHNDLDDLNLERLEVRNMDLPAIRLFLDKYLRDGADTFWERIGGSEGLVRFWQAVHENNEAERFWDEEKGIPSYTSGSDDEDWRKMWQGAKLIPLARNPYLARVICTLHRRQQMPDNRAQLYSAFVDDLYQREYDHAQARGQTFPPREQLDRYLTAVADTMQKQGVTVLAMNALPTNSDLLQASLNATILTQDGDSVRFTHQLLQEYFAARTLLEQMTDNADPRPLFGGTWSNVKVWRETANMLIDFSKDPLTVARWVAGASLPLALEIIDNRKLDIDDTTREILLKHAQNTKTIDNPIGRASAYRVLSMFDADDRKGIGVKDGMPDFIWCEIPAGIFTMGSDKASDPDANDDEMPQHEEDVDRFFMAKYSVTNAQYGAFMDAGGYQHREYWTDAGWEQKEKENWTEPRYWDNPTYNLPTQPVVGVSWYEAYAYTRWLNNVAIASIRQALSLPDNYEIRLAREAEWEKAARGTDGRIYPYGNTYDPTKANVSDTGIGRPSAVGIFPDGESPFEILDMSGNVWEWCLTQWRSNYETVEDNSVSGTNRRVLRGGAFNFYNHFARASFRYFSSFPYDGSSNYGFRIVLSPILKAVDR